MSEKGLSSNLLSLAISQGDGKWAANLLNNGAQALNIHLAQAIEAEKFGMIPMLIQAGAQFDEYSALSLLLSSVKEEPVGLVKSILSSKAFDKLTIKVGGSVSSKIMDLGWKGPMALECMKKADKVTLTSCLAKLCGADYCSTHHVDLSGAHGTPLFSKGVLSTLIGMGASPEVEGRCGDHGRSSALEMCLIHAVNERGREDLKKWHLRNAMELLEAGARPLARMSEEKDDGAFVTFRGKRERASSRSLIRFCGKYDLVECASAVCDMLDWDQKIEKELRDYESLLPLAEKMVIEKLLPTVEAKSKEKKRL